MARKTELGPLAISLGLLFVIGSGLDCLLAGSDRCHFPVVSLDVSEGVDRGYRGAYASDRRFHNLVEHLPTIRDRALTTAEVVTGLPIDDRERYVVRFKDTARSSPFGASSQPVRSETGDVVLVTVSSEQFVLGVMDIHASLVHEFIHGVMRDHMGLARYRALPPWIREGIAVWGAGQLEERSRNVVATAFLERRDPVTVLMELENPRTAPDAYVLDALVFAYIHETFGASTVRGIVQAFTEGHEPEAAFEMATGLGWYQLREETHAFAQRYFEELLAASGLLEFQTAQRLDRFGEREAAIELLESMVENHPQSLLQPNAWYWIGRWRYAEGRFDLAAAAFETVIRRFPKHLGLQDDSQYRLAACFTRLDEYDRALDELERFFRVHTAASRQLQADARYFLGLTQFRLGETDTAADNLRYAAQNSHAHAEEALYHLSQAHSAAGRAFESKLAMSELAYRFPGSQLRKNLREKP